MPKHFINLAILFLLSTLNFKGNAQCTLIPTVSADTISCGDSVAISFATVGAPVLFDDFNSGVAGSGWSFVTPFESTNPCGPSLDGTPTAWMGSVSTIPREMTTVGLDVQCGGTICFDLDFAGDDPCGGCSSCEDPDALPEGVHLRYSTDNGVIWTDIYVFAGVSGGNAPYYSWTNFCFDIPPSAYTANTKFQWIQPNTSGLGWDHWGLDNVQISAYNCAGNPGYYYTWNGSAGDADSTLYPNSSTTYDILYTNGIDDSCSVQIPVTVNPFDASFNYVQSNTSCGDTSAISPTITGDPGGYFTATGGLQVDSLTGDIVPSDNTPGTYTVTYQSGIPSCPGSQQTTVTITPFDPNFTYTLSNASCGDTSAISPTITGDQGGFFTAAGGLQVDPITGDIFPSNNTPGTYTVTYQSGIASCPGSQQAIITITPFDPSFSYIQQNFCFESSAVSPTITGSTGGYFTADNGLSINSSGVFTPDQNPHGTYTITYQSNDSVNCPGSSQVIITNNLPTVGAGNDTTIFSTDQITLTASNPQGGVITWSGGVSDGVGFTPPVGTNEYVVTVNTNGCTTTDTVIVTVITDDNSIGEFEHNAIIYPNPSDGTIWVNVDEPYVIELQDASGKVVFTEASDKKTKFDLNNLPKGVYMVNIQIENRKPILKKLLLK
ncbi:MAG: T9SS type A sorting domain-containing protein [Crocinitomicaceae bacterium]|nr:T9SS type A sorting domain-containing protein [Crocinitomicaceae bacterium]